MRLDGKVAVITGAGSGIGAATALAMAREGARVVVADLNETSAKGVVEQIEKAGGRALAVRADVTKAADNQMVVEKAVATWGGLDIFLANAGVPQFPTPIEGQDETVFDRIFAVNVKGVWLGAKYALAVMKKQKRGVFLITASTGAVVTLTKSLALECAPYGVRVVAIAPVATETPMLATFMGKTEVDAEGMARYIATVPLGRLNKPEDLAQAAVFLASDEAAMITGACLEVDGGRCI